MEMETRSSAKSSVCKNIESDDVLHQLSPAVGEEGQSLQGVPDVKTEAISTREETTTTHDGTVNEPSATATAEKATQTCEEDFPNGMCRCGSIDCRAAANLEPSKPKCESSSNNNDGNNIRYSPISPDGSPTDTPFQRKPCKRIFGIGGPGNFGRTSIVGGGLVIASAVNEGEETTSDLDTNGEASVKSELLSKGDTAGFKNLKVLKNRKVVNHTTRFKMSSLSFIKVSEKIHVLIKLVENLGDPVALSLMLPYTKDHIYNDENINQIVCEVKNMICRDDDNITYTAFISENIVKRIIDAIPTFTFDNRNLSARKRFKFDSEKEQGEIDSEDEQMVDEEEC
jgi:hypothetical protein